LPAFVPERNVRPHSHDAQNDIGVRVGGGERIKMHLGRFQKLHGLVVENPALMQFLRRQGRVIGLRMAVIFQLVEDVGERAVHFRLPGFDGLGLFPQMNPDGDDCQNQNQDCGDDDEQLRALA